VGGLVQQGREYLVGSATQTLAADKQLGHPAGVGGTVTGDPALGGKVTELECPGGYTDAAGAEGDDDGGHLGVPTLDRRPGDLQGSNELASLHDAFDS
jgi:hypothetical protein